MKKYSLLYFLVFFITSSNAQHKSLQQKLYYFISKDSLVGVKSENGKIIIPAVHENNFEHRNNELIKEDWIYLWPEKNDSSEPHSFGLVYNRKGKLLFAPFFFDNGPDGFNEGLTRFVKSKKVGFANKAGKVAIDAKYDYASSFDYGIANYCIGCVAKYENEQIFYTGGNWGYINKKGNELKPAKEIKNIKDQQIDSVTYLPYQFINNPFEQKIIDSFNKLTIISKIHFVNYLSPLTTKERKLYYEIVEKPSSFYPYYHIKAFEFSNNYGYSGWGIDELDFYVTKDGKKYLADDYGKNIPLYKWIRKQTIEAKEFIKTHPDALYKL